MLCVVVGHGHKRNRSDEALSPASSSLSSPPPADGDDLDVITSRLLGEVMSRDDAFYTPHKDNPFATRFADANAKLMGDASGSASWWMQTATPPCTPLTPASADAGVWPVPARRARSLPGSPAVRRRRRASSRLAPRYPDDGSDGDSDASEDSALGLDSGGAGRGTGGRVSVDMFSAPCLWRRPPLPPPASARGRRPPPADGRAPCYSSSESCFSESFDGSCVLSPTSSHGSSRDADLDWTPAPGRHAHLFYEHRLRSRHRFQQLVARWEAAQLRPGAGRRAPSGLPRPAAPTPPLQQLASHSQPLEHRFQKLRLEWETRQQAAPPLRASSPAASSDA